jgi:hypothetical protein
MDKSKQTSSIGTYERTWFSIPQAVDYCAAKNWWIEERLRSGEMPFRKTGHRVLSSDDLDALVQSLPLQRLT